MPNSHTHHGSAYDGADRLGGTLFWFTFGAITAMVALMVDVTLDAVAIGIAQITFEVDACSEGFSDPLLYGVLAVAVLTSLLVGSALWRMRAQVGAKAEEHDRRWALHLRRTFTLSAVGLFVLLSPFKWLLILGMANC